MVRCRRRQAPSGLAQRRAGIRRGWKVYVHDLRVARFEARRSDDGEEPVAFDDVVRFQNEEWHAADVIAVEVRKKDEINLVALDSELVHRHERGGSAIDQRVDVPSDQVEAGIETSARPEGIAAAYGVIDPLATQREREYQTLASRTQHAEGYLDTHAALLHGQGIEIEIDVRCGPAAEVIVEAAESPDISLIAMATHGYSGLRRWALGSVTDRVVHATAKPVLVVRGAKPIPAEPIIVSASFSDCRNCRWIDWRIAGGC